MIETDTTDTTCVNASISKNMNKEIHDHEQILIGDFLDKAEDIAMSTTSITVDHDEPEDDGVFSWEDEHPHGNNPFSSVVVDQAIVQEIIANDDRLHQEVDEFMNMHSMAIDDDEEFDFSTFDFSAVMGFSE